MMWRANQYQSDIANIPHSTNGDKMRPFCTLPHRYGRKIYAKSRLCALDKQGFETANRRFRILRSLASVSFPLNSFRSENPPPPTLSPPSSTASQTACSVLMPDWSLATQEQKAVSCIHLCDFTTNLCRLFSLVNISGILLWQGRTHGQFSSVRCTHSAAHHGVPRTQKWRSTLAVGIS